MKELRELSEKEIRQIYRERMERDFPDNERKPLEMILKGKRDGTYDCLGLFEDGTILAYAFLVRRKKGNSGEELRLLDYLAVSEEKRGGGIGSEMLRMLSGAYQEEICIMAEVEDPEEAPNSQERRLQERRLSFYLRNGYRDTGLKVKTFFVDYKILERDQGIRHTRKQMEALYKGLYRDMVPLFLYLRMIRVKKSDPEG